MIGPDTPVQLGLIAAIIACTATLVWRARGVIDTNKTLAGEFRSLKESLKGFADSLNGHVLKSDTRDRENQEKFHALNRCCDTQAENYKGITKRLEEVVLPKLHKLETFADRSTEDRSNLHTRVSLLEQRDAG